MKVDFAPFRDVLDDPDTFPIRSSEQSRDRSFNGEDSLGTGTGFGMTYPTRSLTGVKVMI
jgi:hypothetical protein